MVNVHLDSPVSDTEERAYQVYLCTNLLTGSTTPSATLEILCGDFNIFSTVELLEVIPDSFQDLIASSSLHPAVENVHAATLGITFATPQEKLMFPPRRSDFVFWRGGKWKCVNYENKGGGCIKDEAGNLIECPRGVDGYLHASDHLAVSVQFEAKMEGAWQNRL